MNLACRKVLVSGLCRRRLEQDRWTQVALVQASSLSTLETMYEKLLSLPPVHYIEDTLAHCHDFTGIPWWGTLVLCTTGLRVLLTLPAQTTSQKVAAKRFLLFKEMNDVLIPALRKGTDMQVLKNQWSEKKAKASFNRVAGELRRAKIIELNCHMSKLFLPLYIQIPVWVFTSVAIRNLVLMRETAARMEAVPVELRFLQLSSEGALWFPNLTIPDHSWILPLMVGSFFALNIFLASTRIKIGENTEVSKYSRRVNYFLYTISALMVPLASIQPAALALYWVTSGLVGVCINLLLLSPSYRRLARIPKTPKDSETPYRDIQHKFVSIVQRQK